MYCASPRTPCSGPKSAASRTRDEPWRRVRVTAVGLHTRPTVRPASAAKRDAARTSRPGTTRTGSALREREAEREAARPVLRVRGIAEVPVGARTDVGVVDGVLEDLDQGGLSRGVH